MRERETVKARAGGTMRHYRYESVSSQRLNVPQVFRCEYLLAINHSVQVAMSKLCHDVHVLEHTGFLGSKQVSQQDDIVVCPPRNCF